MIQIVVFVDLDYERSNKGSKGPGHEYWGKRPFNNNGCDLGTINKRIGIQRERATLKKEEKNEQRITRARETSTRIKKEG